MFNTITTPRGVFALRSDGKYSLNSRTFADPQSEFRLRPAKPALKTGQPGVASVLRVLEKDVTVGASTQRKQCTVQTIITVPRDNTFTTAELADMIADTGIFLDTAVISRMLQGES